MKKMKVLATFLISTSLFLGVAFADDEDFRNPEEAITALGKGGEKTREKAAEYLGDIRYAKAATRLLESLNDSSHDVREEAARALGKIGSKEAVNALIAHLGEGSSGVRAACAEALARIGDPKALEPIRKQRAAEINPINQVRMQRALDQLQSAAGAAK